jgi:hypothetical protein
MFEVDYFELSATDSGNHYKVLNYTPTNTMNVALDVIGGTSQMLGNGQDFTCVDSTVKWDDPSLYGLYTQLVEHDKIRVIYDRS